MARVYWDTMLFVYWLEDHREHGARVGEIHQSMREHGDRLCASTLTVCELLELPQRRGDHAASDRIQRFFRSPAVEILPFPPEVASVFAGLRAATRIAALDAMDALHLAIAATGGVSLFLTHDQRLRRHRVPGIDFIAGLDAGVY